MTDARQFRDHDPSPPLAWQPAGFPGLEILRGSFRNDFPRHYHDGLLVSVTDSGAQEVEYRGARYIAGVGQIVAIPAGDVHAVRARSAGGWSYRVFTVPYALIGFPLHGLHEGFASPVVIDDRELAQQLRAAHAAFACASPKLECEERLTAALHLFFTRHTRPAAPRVPTLRNSQAVGRAIEYLSEHCDRNVALCELAAAAELDGFLLTREFTRSMGMPPHAYHLDRKSVV